MGAASSADLIEFAPAKVHLTLHVLGRRPDGDPEIESLVVFAGAGDRLTLEPGETLALDVGGPTAEAAGATGDNLVIKATRALADRVPELRLGHFRLEKRLPVAAGLGGGSSDAAAALRLLARLNNLSLDERVYEAARVTGADVPVCLDPRARMMRGIGEILSGPVGLGELPAVLVNPGVAVPTAGVFRALSAPALTTPAQPDDFIFPLMDAAAAVAAVAQRRNDLEPPAIKLQPVIDEVLIALHDIEGCRLARMSGSGATCFGIFPTAADAEAAARELLIENPTWWVQATVFR